MKRAILTLLCFAAVLGAMAATEPDGLLTAAMYEQPAK